MRVCKRNEHGRIVRDIVGNQWLWIPYFFYYWPLHLHTFIKAFNQYPPSILLNFIYTEFKLPLNAYFFLVWATQGLLSVPNKLPTAFPKTLWDERNYHLCETTSVEDEKDFHLYCPVCTHIRSQFQNLCYNMNMPNLLSHQNYSNLRMLDGWRHT